MLNTDFLSTITSLTDYLGLIVSAWLAFYLLSRDPGNNASMHKQHMLRSGGAAAWAI